VAELVKDMQNITDAQTSWLRGMPEHVRDKAKAAFDRFNKLTPEERKAEDFDRRRDFERGISEGLHLREKKLCGLDGKQWLNTFGTYLAQTTEQKAALKAARNFVADWPDVDKGLMFYGPPGRGKDHLLHAIIIALFDRKDVKVNVHYWYSLDIERDMIAEWDRDSATKSSDDSRTEELMRECDLLLVGDLHKVLHVKSPQIMNAMRRTINQCEGTGKPILCATGNYSLADYDKLFGDSLGSRLAACCEWHHIDGVDMRRTKPNTPA
jgi:DNA replication protein DnaC